MTGGPLVVLVGPMGSGKSTVGALLAERLGVPYRDTDADIVAAQGREISDIFLDAGTRALLAGLPVAYLSMDVEEAVRRVGLGAARPLLAVNPRRQWRELMEARRPLYTEVARVVVATDERTPEEVAQAVLDALELKDV